MKYVAAGSAPAAGSGCAGLGGTFTGHGTTVVDAPGPRTEMVLVALAVGTPPGTGTRRTLAGVGKAKSMEFHGS